MSDETGLSPRAACVSACVRFRWCLAGLYALQIGPSGKKLGSRHAHRRVCVTSAAPVILSTSHTGHDPLACPSRSPVSLPTAALSISEAARHMHAKAPARPTLHLDPPFYQYG